MIIDEIMDGDKDFDDPFGEGIVLYPENDSDLIIIEVLRRNDFKCLKEMVEAWTELTQESRAIKSNIVD